MSAFAVSSAYYPENPLKLSAGQTTDFQFTLQNVGETENLSARATIAKGSEIIQITDPTNIYFVPAGGKTKVNLRATIPENAKAGQVYNFEIVFTTISTPQAGTFGFGSSIKQTFNVIVEPKPGEIEQKPEIKNLNLVIGAIILILITIIIIIILKRKKK